MGVTGDKAEEGGLIGERLVGEATVREERLRERAVVVEAEGGRSCW